MQKTFKTIILAIKCEINDNAHVLQNMMNRKLAILSKVTSYLMQIVWKSNVYLLHDKMTS